MKKSFLPTAFLIISMFFFIGFTFMPDNNIKNTALNNSSSYSNTELDFKSGTVELKMLAASEPFDFRQDKKPPIGYNQEFDLDSKAKELNIDKDALSTILEQVKTESQGDDPLTDAISQQTILGYADFDYFGFPVASAGDVNGDGYDDIIVAATGYSGLSGRVYIYHGSSSGIVTMPASILEGIEASSLFGNSVSGAGDINGDGYDDIVIGAPQAGSFGRAYVYYGSSTGINPGSNNFVIINGTTGSNFGYSVSRAGDVNGDGYADIIIGAYTFNSNTGRAFVYKGTSTGVNIIPIATFNGEATNNFFGIYVSGGGDVNGDGYDDVIVGASRYNYYTGRTYVFHGSSTSMSTTPATILTGAATNDYFGSSVSVVGDVNGDGYSDIMVGAYNSLSQRGRAYLYVGSPTGVIATPNASLQGEATSNRFGISVSGAGDVNGDGYSDVIVGAENFSSGTGRAYVYFGSSTGINSSPNILLNGEANLNSFGLSVSGAGDVNGDGYSDILVGAPGYNNQRGKVYIYKNTMTGFDIPDLVLTGAAAFNNFGWSISGAGDVNGDGYTDIIVGAYGYNSDRGRAYIYHGSSSGINTTPATILTGEATSNYFGLSVSDAGDVNGDGYSDIIVGAYGYNSSTGRAYLYHGSSTGINTTPAAVLTGEATNNQFGWSVSGVGDVNGDGYSDIIVGAYGYNSFRGRAYVYHGLSSGINTTPAAILTGEAGNSFGISISGAGDVNGDGYADIIVGASGYNSSTGRAYLYRGSANGINATPAAVLTGEETINHFGESVSGAGDVNGDGYSDIIVGAWGYSSNTGRVYLYHGSSTGIHTTPAAVLTGEETLNRFGGSVSGAGDVNGDGYSDIIVGTLQLDFERAYIFFGGINVNITPDIILEQYSGGTFGRSVTNIGDINKDGLSDIAVGSPGYNILTGRVYIYMSSAPIVKPRLVSVKDVPNDQGGFVHVRWMRSGYDVLNINKITDYLIERSRPPDNIGFSWEPISTIPASFNPSYTFTSPTWSDSNFNGSQRVYFRITARTNNSSEFWRSNIVYGQSIDNLAPVPPMNLLAGQTQTSVNLEWSRNSEPDLHFYKIYRNDTLIGNSTVNNFTDVIIAPRLSPESNTNDLSTPTDNLSMLEYNVSAVDINGNESDLSNPVQVNFSPFTNFRVTVIPSGFYNPITTHLNMSDTVKAYLVSASVPYNIVDSATSVIDSITFIADFKFENADDGDYYLVIVHRNSLETWSKAGGLNFERGVDASYDFTTAADQSYGSNMVQISGLWCIISGDVNGNGIIDAVDRAMAWNERNKSGYFAEDVNGDGLVDAQDRGIIWNNRNKSTFTPGLLIRKQNEIITNDKMEKGFAR